MKLLALMLFAATTIACASDAHMRKSEEEGEGLRRDLAETYVKKGAYDAALPFLIHELRDNPKDARTHLLYATVLRERGLYPQAEKEFLTVLQLSPNDPAAWAGAAVLYDLEHNPERANTAHHKAVTMAPGNALYWNNLGFSLYIAGKNDEAITALEKALSLDPGLTIAYDNVGFAYGKRGAYHEAERSFRTAGGEINARVNMAIVYEAAGNHDEAARLRAEAKSMDPKLDLPSAPPAPEVK